MDQLNDKVAVISGASAGIGAAIAEKFASAGCKLALLGRNVENLNAVAAKCAAQGLDKSKIITAVGDVTSEKDMDDMASKIVEYFQQVDILVNNAGVFRSGGIEKSKMEDFDHLYSIFIRSVVYQIKKYLPYIKASKGNIINISSECAIRPHPIGLAYCTVKAGQDQMMRCIAVELAPQGVRVNSINPSKIRTDIIIRSGKTLEQQEQIYEDTAKDYPIGRVGEPEEVAEAALFLASNKASFITGTSLVIDGGCSLTVGAF